MAAVLIGPRCNREVPWIAFWRMCAVLSVMLRGTSHARAATAMRSNSRTLRAARYMATNRGRGPAHSVEALVSKARKRKMPVVILTNLGAPSPNLKKRRDVSALRAWVLNSTSILPTASYTKSPQRTTPESLVNVRLEVNDGGAKVSRDPNWQRRCRSQARKWHPRLPNWCLR